ncbi:MAG: amidohydrolase family protein [Bacteroidota bacterium]
MKKLSILSLFLCMFMGMSAQEYFPKNDGVKEENNNFTAFTNATLHVTPTQVINGGTLLIQKGKVIAAGSNVTIPGNAILIDLDGKHVYPSFIESFSDFGIEKPKRKPRNGRSAQYEPSREGFYWNDHIMPENDGITKFSYDKKRAATLRKAGFGVVNSHIMDGIARGTGVLVALNDEDGDETRVLEDTSGQFFSFSKSVTSLQSYPGSLMGALALLRQLHYDLDWYQKGNASTKDRSLEAMIENKNLVSFIDAGNKGNNLRADNFADEFGLDFVIVGGGDEYEAIANIKATNARYIIPLNFPSAFDVSDPYQAKYVSLEDMRAWNQAPSNLKVLAENGVTFSLTTHDLKKVTDFHPNLRKAIRYGFNKTKALEALTTVPAALLGKSNELGTLEKGKYANFLITSGDIFDKETTLFENWVQGARHVINDKDQKDIRGSYNLTAAGKQYQMKISGSASKPKLEIKQDTVKFPSKLTYKGNWVTFSFSSEDKSDAYAATGIITKTSENFNGRLILPNGSESSFFAARTVSEEEKKKDKEKSMDAPEVVPVTYPNVGYGFANKPRPQNTLFKNATVWTGEDAGILETTDVLVKDGKIARIGKNLSPGGATVVDATGKHLTAGIIDEHSHIAALSINEGGQNSSAEVSIEDVVDPEDIDIYRNLAGGVTSIQILHGSANPIGGRSAIIKLKWGEDAQGLIYDNSPKFIKFALGENVKQSNWQSFSRFPQTRMGVEQLYVNYFNRAKAYDARKKSGRPYRKDTELEVLAEVLNGERYISCHSYVQSEINMLMKVAERFNFRVNTFTHILEGYKVADKMKEHGVGGSTFSDWWAYKYEVNDAIPYNAAIMSKVGVTVAINSDDGEMSRRLNQEAAKGVKYGGMSEKEAWKMVTINPAKLLHLDDRTGSIKEGKDADLVLWSDHPLSVYAKAEKTMIDGTVYFDLETDKAKRRAIQNERNKLMKMMLAEKEGGGKTRPPRQKDKIHFHCDTVNYSNHEHH